GSLFGWGMILLQIWGKVVDGEVLSRRCRTIRLGRALPVALRLVLARELFVAGRRSAPLAAPVVPGSDARAGGHEVVVIDSLNDHARRPGFQNVIDGRVRMFGEHAKSSSLFDSG